jgi:protein ImuA
MGSATRQQEVLEELRSQIRRMERRPARREGVLSCGRPDLEALLPGGGFARGALSSLCGGPASGKTGVALSALREAQDGGGLVAFVDGRGELYPPAALELGVNLARLLIVRPEPARGSVLPGLWAAEVLLASGAFPAVVIDVSLRGVPSARAEPMLRRLRAAAEKGGAAALLLSGPGDPAIPAAVRIDLDALRPAEGGHAA